MKRIEIFLLLLLSAPLAAQVSYSFSEQDINALREILAEDEKKALDGLQILEDKVAWAKLYWKGRDPTPTTAKNERLEEFLRRLTHARSWYSAHTKIGFDDRGRIYLRYGEPTEKFEQPIGDLVTKPNESWSYNEIAPGLVFDFVSIGPYYRLVDDLSRALGSRTEPGQQFYTLLSLYQSRAFLDPVYGRIADELRRISTTGGFGGVAMMNEAQLYLAEAIGESHKLKAEAPPAVLSHDYQQKSLPIAMSVARFRADNGKVRVEVYYGIPFNQLGFTKEGRYWTTPLKGVAAVLDAGYRMIAADSVDVRLTATNESALRSAAYLSQSNFLLSPGKYILSLRMENEPANRLGILTADLTCPKFPPDALAISDLQLSPQISLLHESVLEHASQDRFVKQDLRIIPLPGLTVEKARTFFVYFEIYNLAPDENGMTTYDLNYTLKVIDGNFSIEALSERLKDRKPEMSITETRTGQTRDEKIFIGVDFGQQKPGRYLLDFSIHDQNGKATAQSSVPIRVVSRAEE